MKVKVKTEGHLFEVDLGNLHLNPVIAMIDGERFEIWVDEIKAEVKEQPAVERITPTPSFASTNVRSSATDSALYAPLPGMIVSIEVQPGAFVSVGQELCALEAMKMKNTIRASRAGQIAEVCVSVGQFVKHRELLMKYEES